MDESGKKLNELKIKLQSTDTEDIVRQVNDLRNMESIPGVILLLAGIHDNDPGPGVKKAIEKFFNDLKTESLKEEIIQAISSSRSAATRRKLISSCWQSGLDYSMHMDIFIDYSISGDYETALECYSVIEQFIDHCTDDNRQRWKEKISLSLDDSDEHRHNLTKAIISLL